MLGLGAHSIDFVSLLGDLRRFVCVDGSFMSGEWLWVFDALRRGLSVYGCISVDVCNDTALFFGGIYNNDSYLSLLL